MATVTASSMALPPLDRLPSSLPLEGAVRIELEEGIPIFRVSSSVQDRITNLLDLQQIQGLTELEEEELDAYEEIDDYLSFINRTIRNLVLKHLRCLVLSCPSDEYEKSSRNRAMAEAAQIAIARSIQN